MYSKDGNTVTVYIAQGAGKYVSPVEAGFDSTGRALSLPLAQLGHDFFEVVFFYNHNNNPADHVVARATWQRGQRAGVSGVYRGADYSGVTYNPNPGSGSAVLFVGNGQDKTLLAVGKISHVDETAVNNGPAVIAASTTSVTFTVDALKSSVDMAPANSSFLTAAGRNPDARTVNTANTQTVAKEIAGKEFPMFEIVRGIKELHAWYTLTTVSGNFAAYNNAIILSGEGKAEKREPRYSTPEGNIRRESNVFLDDQTVITLPNHDENGVNDVGLPFKNPVVFSLDTEFTREGSIFALVFEIPVIALSSLSNPVQWYIRPAYGTYLYDLDDGNGGAGGAILCGNGFVYVAVGARLVVITPPQKYQYNRMEGGNFILEHLSFAGLQVELQDEHGNKIRDIDPNDENLVFLIGGYRIPHTPSTPFVFSQYYGLVWIEVAYDDPYTNYLHHGELFPVLVTTNNIAAGTASNEQSGFVNFTDYSSRRYRVTTTNDFLNLITAGGIYVIILGANVDIPQITTNMQSAVLVMIVADGANRTLGRESGGHIIFQHNRFHSYNQFYFGEWPFPEPLTPVGQPTYWASGNTAPTVTTVPYRINAGGSAATFGGASTATGRMIRGFEAGARITNVRVELPTANVWLRDQLH